MPNPKVTSPNLDVRGFRNESVTNLTAGLGVIAGTAEDQVEVAGAAAVAIKGVVALDQDVPEDGIVSIHVGFGGECYVRSGAAFAVDAPLTTDSTGRWVTAVSTDEIHAIARGAAAGANELIAAIRTDGDAVV